MINGYYTKIGWFIWSILALEYLLETISSQARRGTIIDGLFDLSEYVYLVACQHVQQ